MSCLAEQVKILVAEAEENNLDVKVLQARWDRWHTCSLCEQEYHGIVRCALGWACWKTNVGRPETDRLHGTAMNLLGGGLYAARHREDALSVQEAELAMRRRIGAAEEIILAVQSNLAVTYDALGRFETALQMKRDVHSGTLKLYGEESIHTLTQASNYAASFIALRRFAEAKPLFRKTIPVARRVLGESHENTLKMRLGYAAAIYFDAGATLDDLREAVTTLEDTTRIAQRVFGASHPNTTEHEKSLRRSRNALAARDGGVSAIRDAVEAMTPGGA